MPIGIEFVPSRYQGIREALDGYVQTHVPLIASDGKHLKPACFPDDVGPCYFVPQIATRFHLDLDQALLLFVKACFMTGLLSGVIGCLLLFRSWRGRIASLCMLLFAARFVYNLGDVYPFAFSIAVGIVPLFVYLYRRQTPAPMLTAFTLLAGIAIDLSNWTRAHSATAVLLFLIILIALGTAYHRNHKLLMLGALMMGVSVPHLYFIHMLNQREAFLAAQNQPVVAIAREHLFWHSVYIGLGYLDNSLNIRYSDAYAANKVASINPRVAVYSVEYESIIKQEVFKFIRANRYFFVVTLAAKTGVILFHALLFANIGVPAILRRRKLTSLDVAFGIALAFSSLTGLLVIPAASYITGLIAFSLLFGIVRLSETWERSAQEQQEQAIVAATQVGSSIACAE